MILLKVFYWQKNNENKNPEESYNNKYQNHVRCGYGYKWVFVDDQFSKLFKSCLGEDAVHESINCMLEKKGIVDEWWNKN